jgi:benzoyl-CoA reductase/2-hydroxyglutaryl-CoA dehydratase subunit BcrC/BadD/HgdB
MKKVGITTTIPVEALFASDVIPIDLNNIFVTDRNPARFVDEAHSMGFPKSICTWIKAQYAIALEKKVDALVAVITGDCSNTHALAELLLGKLPIFKFSYPLYNNRNHSLKELKHNIAKLLNFFVGNEKRLMETTKRLDIIRKKLKEMDKLTIEGMVKGYENRLWLLTSSDFNGEPDKYETELDEFLKDARAGKPDRTRLRLGYIGVPTIFTDLHKYVYSLGADFVFNEVERQFSIPFTEKEYYQRYLDYTYPYGIFPRIRDIKKNIRERHIAGLVHYVQTFCHRQIQDLQFKNCLDIPILTIEGDTPQELDERSKIRLESFIEMLNSRKGRIICD